MKKYYALIILLICVFKVEAQLQAKVSAFLQYHTTDSQTIKHRSREAMIKMNINTGEVKLTVPLNSFAKTDTALYNTIADINTKMELFFSIDGDPFSLHSSRKQESVFEVPGMLHINNHYHHVRVRFSVFRKSEQPTKEDLSYLISISFKFLPKHYELEKLKELTHEPIKISLYKQPYSFHHNIF